jgi:alpha-beta hydrolase superfamily lysophospholipase
MWVTKLLTSVALVPVIYLGISGGLTLSQRPAEIAPTAGEGLDFTQTLASDLSGLSSSQPIKMRDGTDLSVRRYGEPGNGPLVALLHGSGWHGMQFHGLATALAQDADVIVPDLRGHGVAPQRRGDVDYIGQFEDDLADLITSITVPNQQVALVGHSSGGGLVVRMAGGDHGGLIDKAVLLAPFLKYNAPTTRQNSGGWTRPLSRRLIGLSMLNQIGLKAFNHLTAIQFAMPRAVLDGPLGDTATTAYSFRLNTGFAPRADYEKDIAALPEFLLICGTADEAFVAQEYEPLMSALNDKGTYELIPDVGHLDVVNDSRTALLIKGMLHDN